MYLSKIELTNYRNYSKLKVKLDPNINIFIGNNAQGKTNILESIYVLALTKSHRYGVENNLIRKEMLACRIKGTIKEEKKIKDLQFVLTNKSEKKVVVNDKEVKKISDYIFNMKVIMFCPDDLEMIKGSPAFRRNFMNIEISQLFQFYAQYLNEYNKILKNRNEYLKLLNMNQYTDLRYLEILNDKLVEKAVFVYACRKRYMDFIGAIIGDIYEKISGLSGLTVRYENNIDLVSYDEEEIRTKFMEKLTKNQKREMLQGTTLYGPHRDDFTFFLVDDDLKVYGSEGQKRLAIIAFKLAEVQVFYQILNTTPILLLDDIFSELDVKKRNRLIACLPSDIQIIITTTDLKNINRKLVEKAKVFVVDQGKITEKVGDNNGNGRKGRRNI